MQSDGQTNPGIFSFGAKPRELTLWTRMMRAGIPLYFNLKVMGNYAHVRTVWLLLWGFRALGFFSVGCLGCKVQGATGVRLRVQNALLEQLPLAAS